VLGSFVFPAKAGTQPKERNWVAAFAGMTMFALAAPAAAQDKQPPYWASIASGEAMMRTGPGRNYPGIWLYKRRDLPVRVVKTYPNWRMIEDPDGTRGWMLVSLLSDRRTAMVRPGEPRPIHAEPSATSRLRYRAEAGVVGRIEKCSEGWCRIAIGKREGYIRVADIWGVAAGEAVD
jgi:SH3-like domain-containing protein